MEKQNEKSDKKRKEQENLWLQDKLLTSTYNTGPDGCVGGPQNQRNDGETKITKKKYF